MDTLTTTQPPSVYPVVTELLEPLDDARLNRFFSDGLLFGLFLNGMAEIVVNGQSAVEASPSRARRFTSARTWICGSCRSQFRAGWLQVIANDIPQQCDVAVCPTCHTPNVAARRVI